MMAEVILERNEMQKIRSYGEKHHEGPAFGRTPDDDELHCARIANKCLPNLRKPGNIRFNFAIGHVTGATNRQTSKPSTQVMT